MCLIPPMPRHRSSNRNCSHTNSQPELDQGRRYQTREVSISGNPTPSRSPNIIGARPLVQTDVAYQSPSPQQAQIPQCQLQQAHQQQPCLQHQTTEIKCAFHVPLAQDQHQPPQSLASNYTTPNRSGPPGGIDCRSSWQKEQDAWQRILERIENRERDKQAKRDTELFKRNVEEVNQLKSLFQERNREEIDKERSKILIEDILAKRDTESRRSSQSKERQRNYVRESSRSEREVKTDAHRYVYSNGRIHGRRVWDRRISEGPRSYGERRISSPEVLYEDLRGIGRRGQGVNGGFDSDIERAPRDWGRREVVRVLVEE